MKRSQPLRRYNRKRRAEDNAKRFGPQAGIARALPCSVPDCRQGPPSDPAHVRSRGAGGEDRGNVISLCRSHHIQQGAWGVETFQRRTGLDMRAEALRLERLAYADAQHRQELVAEARQLQSPLGSDRLESMTPDDLAAHVRALQEDL